MANKILKADLLATEQRWCSGFCTYGDSDEVMMIA